ncbi:patatin-like phospholipase family protein [Halobacteriaceae archaeon GCM10025711]
MSDADDTAVAVACQGGGSHTAFSAGVLKCLVRDLPPGYELTGLSGTSGGAICAVVAWYGLLTGGPDRARSLLDSVWEAIAATTPADRVFNDWLVWGSRVASSGVPVPEVSPYYTPLSKWGQERLRETLEDHVDFDRLADLVDPDSPQLIVGTVNLNEGDFETFRDGEVTADAVLASAAVPDIYRAVEIHDHWHWDGLFSQNPPVNDFLEGARGRKPDEIWVVQINPQDREGEPKSLEEIADRRNELSGNISLNQELRFIETVNDWVDAGHLPADRYKRVEIRKIAVERAFHCSTKVDRDPAFLREMRRRGEEQATAFLGDLD